MKKYAVTSIIAALCLTSAALTSCSSKKNSGSKKFSEDEIITFTSFFKSQGTERSDDNDIKQLIAEKIGARCDEVWLSENVDPDKIFGDMMISGEYPDFIYGGSDHYQTLLDVNAFIPIDNYWDDYPNLKNMYSDQEWDRVREADGHIYVIPLFSKVYDHDTNTSHSGEAFWIQVKVLQWAGYPTITTLDEYFDLIEAYLAANPCDEEGVPYIGYEVLASEECFFPLENPPQFLSGYPNDGICLVDPETLTAMDYNITDTAEKWFRKLNEEYHKGVIDQESFVMTRDQYREKISQGHVLGFCDQKWNFEMATPNLPDECQYVPIGVVIDEGIEEHYHSQVEFNDSAGLSITVSCDDVEAAVKFVNDLLSPEIHTLRFWGVEGEDYLVGDDGIFYLTDEQQANRNNGEFLRNHICEYNYFPCYFGMDQDGINAYSPAYQPSEFYKRLSGIMKECFDAYGVQTYVELLNQAEENPPWYPMWSYSNSFTTNTDYGRVLKNIEAVKHKYLPLVVMSDDFDSVWKEYKENYYNCNPEVLFNELTDEVRRRSNVG